MGRIGPVQGEAMCSEQSFDNHDLILRTIPRHHLNLPGTGAIHFFRLTRRSLL